MAHEDEQQSKRFKKFHPCETLEDPPTLPQEIIVDILTRLHVESLLRCKPVCKSWCSFISDPHFIKSHLSMSASNNHYSHHRIIFTPESRNNPCICSLYNLLNCKIDIVLDHGQPLNEPPEWSSLSSAGSCNGLLCVVVWCDPPFILNPATRFRYRLPCGVKKYSSDEFYGFGYDKSTDDNKVVLISRLNSYLGPANNIYRNRVKIYSLKTGVWKKQDDFPYDEPLNDSGKFSNRALHWVAGDLSSSWTIVSIDLANETYGELALGVWGECLCVLCNYDQSHADVWLMKVYGMKDSWTNLVSIRYLTHPGRDRFSKPLNITNDGKVLLHLGLKLIGYDSKKNSFCNFVGFTLRQMEA